MEPPFNVFPVTALQKGVTLPFLHPGSYSFRLDTLAPQGTMTLTMRSRALAERYRLETSTFAARFLG